VRSAPAIVCVALLVGAAACTIGPAAGDGGTGGSTATTPARTVGDQCESVLSVYCQKAASCALVSDLSACLTGNMALCCVGTACNATSTVSEATVSECEQMIMTEDCYPVSITMNPTSCIVSP
jgi:hypothetical protein